MDNVKAKQICEFDGIKFDYFVIFPEVIILNFTDKLDTISKIEKEPSWCEKSKLDVEKSIESFIKEETPFWKKLFNFNRKRKYV